MNIDNDSYSSNFLSNYLQVFNTEVKENPFEMQLSQMKANLRMKTIQIERLQVEIKSLIRLQREKSEKLKNILLNNLEIENKLNNLKKNEVNIQENFLNLENNSFYSLKSEKNVKMLDDGLFLKILLNNDEQKLIEISRILFIITDEELKIYIGEQILLQMQKFIKIQKSFEIIFNEKNLNLFNSIFETEIKKLIDCNKIILWNKEEYGELYYSPTLSLVSNDKNGIISLCIESKNQQINQNKKNVQ